MTDTKHRAASVRAQCTLAFPGKFGDVESDSVEGVAFEQETHQRRGNRTDVTA